MEAVSPCLFRTKPAAAEIIAWLKSRFNANFLDRTGGVLGLPDFQELPPYCQASGDALEFPPAVLRLKGETYRVSTIREIYEGMWTSYILFFCSWA